MTSRRIAALTLFSISSAGCATPEKCLVDNDCSAGFRCDLVGSGSQIGECVACNGDCSLPSVDAGPRPDGGPLDAGPATTLPTGFARLSVPTTNFLQAVWGTSANDVWISGSTARANGTSMLFHWNGSQLTHEQDFAVGHINEFYGTSRDNIWAVGDESIFHYDGSRWSQLSNLTFSGSWQSVWGSGTRDIWAVGAQNAISHFDGTSWTLHNPGGLPLAAYVGLWGVGANDIWATAALGSLIHWNGTSWTEDLSLPRNDPGSWTNIWGSATNDFWAVGRFNNTPAVLGHWDGAVWSAHSNTTAGILLVAIWGASANNVYAAGLDIIHYDGNAWSDVRRGIGGPVRDIWGSGPDDIWMVGDDGLILHGP